MLRVLFPFLLGIIAGGAIELGFRLPVGAIPVAVVMLFILIHPLRKIIPFRLRWLAGLLVNILLVATGFELTQIHQRDKFEDFDADPASGCHVCQILDQPLLKDGKFKVSIRVLGFFQGGVWKESHGTAMIYCRINPAGLLPEYGDMLLLKTAFRPVEDNANPNNFSYSRYLKSKGISAVAFVRPHEWHSVSCDSRNFLRTMSFKLRDRMLDVFKHNRIEGREFAVAAALLLGYVDEIDPELRNQYAATGAMHILSVSGMHVGIIFLFLEFILGFMNRHRMTRILKAVLIILFVWFYAFLTGLSPSVLRSAAMLSLIIAGKTLDRSPDIMNILAASMFFILVSDPFLVRDVGFQLSYLAVAGIVLLYKPIYDLYVTSMWVPDKIWSMIAVSLAAQISTMPLSFYVFHQFPNYFLLTNVAVVPLSSLIIYLGILVLSSGMIPFITYWSAYALSALVWMLNTVIGLIEGLPYSTSRGIFISLPEMIIFYFFIIVCFLFLSTKKKRFLFLCLAILVVFAGNMLLWNIFRLNSNRLIMYHVRNSSVIEMISQDKSILIYSHRKYFSGSAGGYCDRDLVKNNNDALGVKRRREFWMDGSGQAIRSAHSFSIVKSNGNFILFKQKRIAVLRLPIPKGLNSVIAVDYLVISGSPRVHLADLQRAFTFKKLIVDATNSYWLSSRWREEANEAGIECHLISEKGAFEEEF
jgi:competence protein ComEC